MAINFDQDRGSLLGINNNNINSNQMAFLPDFLKNFFSSDPTKIQLGEEGSPIDKAKDALEKGLPNVAFLRTQIELLAHVFDSEEVSEIWITFPDPQIKFKRTKHRLTNPTFLEIYKNLLQPKGQVHLKTDSEFLHGYTLGLLEGMGISPLYAHHDIYGNPHAPEEATAIQTHYERLFLETGKSITYLTFSF